MEAGLKLLFPCSFMDIASSCRLRCYSPFFLVLVPVHLSASRFPLSPLSWCLRGTLSFSLCSFSRVFFSSGPPFGEVLPPFGRSTMWNIFSCRPLCFDLSPLFSGLVFWRTMNFFLPAVFFFVGPAGTPGAPLASAKPGRDCLKKP